MRIYSNNCFTELYHFIGCYPSWILSLILNQIQLCVCVFFPPSYCWFERKCHWINRAVVLSRIETKYRCVIAKNLFERFFFFVHFVLDVLCWCDDNSRDSGDVAHRVSPWKAISSNLYLFIHLPMMGKKKKKKRRIRGWKKKKERERENERDFRRTFGDLMSLKLNQNYSLR